MYISLEDFLGEDDLEIYNKYLQDEKSGKRSFFDADEYSIIAGAYIFQGKMKKAEEVLKEALEMYPDSVEVRMKMAEYWMESGLHDKAVTILEEIEETDYFLHELQLLKAHALKEVFRYDEAREAVEKASEAGAEEVDVAIAMASIYVEEQRFEMAWKYTRKILGRPDDSVEEGNSFVMLVKKCAVEDRAIEYMQKLLKDHPFSTLYWKIYSEILESAEMYPQALDAIEYVLAIDSSDQEAMIRKFDLLDCLENPKPNLDFYLGLCQKITDPEYLPSIYLRTGQEYELQGEVEQAAVYYQKALSYPQTCRHAMFRLGVIEHYRGNLEKAMKIFEQALQAEDIEEQKDRNSAFILRGAARNYYYRGDGERALKFTRMACEMEPEEIRHLLALAVDAYHLGLPEKALEFVRTLDDKKTDIVLVKAVLEFACNHLEEAYIGFAKAFKDPLTRRLADVYVSFLYTVDEEILALRNVHRPGYVEMEEDKAEERAFSEFYGPLPERYGK